MKRLFCIRKEKTWEITPSLALTRSQFSFREPKCHFTHTSKQLRMYVYADPSSVHTEKKSTLQLGRKFKIWDCNWVKMEALSSLVKVTLPNYLSNLPIPDSITGWFKLGCKLQNQFLLEKSIILGYSLSIPFKIIRLKSRTLRIPFTIFVLIK